jgi:hypothetical protein
MKNILFSLFAIALAGVAAIAATTAMLNAPATNVTVHNIGPPAADKKPDATGTATPPAPTGDRPATPAPIPDADKPAPGGATTPTPAPEPTTTPGGAKPAAEPGKEDEDGKADADPYEGIAPEDLPPDLQYDADSSVSFPTNI